MLKPIQNLGAEVGVHFAKIRRYAPEILERDETSDKMPWTSIEQLAAAVEDVKREDLINVWNSMIINKSTRARVVSHVYGTTFPISKGVVENNDGGKRLDTIESILSYRKSLDLFHKKSSSLGLENNFWRSSVLRVAKPISSLSPNAKIAFAGFGLIGLTGIVLEKVLGSKRRGTK